MTALANGSTLTVRPPAGAGTRPVCRQRRFNHWTDDFYYEGGWEVGPLRDALTGHVSTGGDQSACTFAFEGCGLILQFWSHPWSGVAAIDVDGVSRTVDLFGETPAMKNVHFDGLPPGAHVVRISGLRRTDGKHPGDQVVFHEAVVYDRLTEIIPSPTGETTSPKPGRFNAIFHAPGALGWPERTVLYGTAFGARPRNALVVGKGQAGAAAIVVAALDDLGAGSLTCVDPDPNITPELWQKLGQRTSLVIGVGAAALAEARVRGAADFDFAFVDLADNPAPDWSALVRGLRADAILLVHAARADFDAPHPALTDGGPLVPTAAPGASGLRLLRRR